MMLCHICLTLSLYHLCLSLSLCYVCLSLSFCLYSIHLCPLPPISSVPRLSWTRFLILSVARIHTSPPSLYVRQFIYIIKYRYQTIIPIDSEYPRNCTAGVLIIVTSSFIHQWEVPIKSRVFRHPIRKLQKLAVFRLRNLVLYHRALVSPEFSFKLVLGFN